MRETTTNEARRIANRIRQNARDVDETAGGGVPSASAWSAFSARNRALWDEATAAGVLEEVTRIVAARVGGAS